MAISHKDDFPLDAVRSALTSRGWDVAIEETLSAEQDDGAARLRLVVDKGGRMILRRSVLAKKPVGMVVRRDGRAFAWQREIIEVSHVTTSIETPEAFEKTLSTMLFSLINQPPEVASG